jgi:hypothetical protein
MSGNGGHMTLLSGPAPTGTSGILNLASHDNASGTGTASLYSGDSSAGSSGNVWVFSGMGGAGDSGNVNIQTGTASGTRGNIVLDAPRVICAQGLTFLSDSSASGQPFEIGSHGHTSESAATGNVDVFSGDITSDSKPTGSVSIGSGFVTGAAHSGIAQIYTGDSSGGNSGDIQLVTGTAAGDSGTITLQTGTASGTRGDIAATARVISLVADDKIILDAQSLICPIGNNYLELGTEGVGGVDIFTGSQTGTNQSGAVSVATGNTENAHTGGLQIFTGSASGVGAYNSGSIGIFTGNPGATGTRGNIVLDALRVLLLNAPTSDPHEAGALWVDTSAGRVVKCSAGP